MKQNTVTYDETDQHILRLNCGQIYFLTTNVTNLDILKL